MTKLRLPNRLRLLPVLVRLVLGKTFYSLQIRYISVFITLEDSNSFPTWHMVGWRKEDEHVILDDYVFVDVHGR